MHGACQQRYLLSDWKMETCLKADFNCMEKVSSRRGRHPSACRPLFHSGLVVWMMVKLAVLMSPSQMCCFGHVGFSLCIQMHSSKQDFRSSCASAFIFITGSFYRIFAPLTWYLTELMCLNNLSGVIMLSCTKTIAEARLQLTIW